jgi:hypothetical protein
VFFKGEFSPAICIWMHLCLFSVHISRVYDSVWAQYTTRCVTWQLIGNLVIILSPSRQLKAQCSCMQRIGVPC